MLSFSGAWHFEPEPESFITIGESGGTIILHTVSSAPAEKHTFVFALRNEKEFSSSNLCPSVGVRFKKRSPGFEMD